MQESPVCKRLDRFLYSNEWELSFPQSLQEVLPRWTSDHWPIVLDTNPFKWGPTPFRFENMWLQHHNFKESFSSWWREFEGNGWEGHKFMRKLQFVKAKLKDWNKNTFGMLKERKKTILDEIANIDAIEQEGALSSDLAAQRVIRKGELEELILREEIHWKQKAKIKWVKEGDCNSKLFHKVANGRRNKNFIKLLENERGLVLDSSESITEEILLYFKKLYSSPPGESWRVEGIDWSPISEESASRLDSPFAEAEIFNAIFQLDRDKAPGPDFHHSSISGLLGCDQGRLRRLRGVLQETIHSTQGAFVQGRQILDAVLIANEIVDEKKRSGEEGVVFKIDFEKAYDHVKWDFLDHVLEKKGFSSKWRSWMRGCLSSVSYAILVNGNAKGWVKAARGLRQGDPLSPFLFTIVADVLSRMLLKAEERNLLEGFRVNLDKSNLFGINLDQNHLSRLALLLDCKASDWPILYLGLPLGGNPTACGFWDPIPASVAAKIKRIQRDFLWSGVGEGKRDHLVRWEAVCKPRVIGGLGIGKTLRNRALLGKWLWRFPRESTSLWHQSFLAYTGHTQMVGMPIL
ncbi:putative mitochondrial protein [Vitis vinifera]|uniref:Putative mitochondrial protein n=1 Tax=Vitis vinifera TaxID=29760 RepID=A0A438FRA3_VITVI|nr:putative mitochondrial protein [Vitis vinifera]